MNVSTGKQIIGFETEAMELMSAFSWPHNLDQLHHIIKELVIVTKTPYITCQDVKDALEAEPDHKTDDATSGFDFSGTLDEMNYQIIQMVLSEEHGNKEKTGQAARH